MRFLAGSPIAARFAAVESLSFDASARSALISVVKASHGVAVASLLEGSAISEPRWHPERLLLATVVDGHLLLCDLQGRAEHLGGPPTGSSITSLSWLHASALVVGTDHPSGTSSLYVVGLPGGRWERLVDIQGRCLGAEASPDGARVAVVERELGRPPDAAQSRLWIIDIRGGQRSHVLGQFGGVMQPRWAPDGRRLAALVRRPDPAHWSDNWRIALLTNTTWRLVGDAELNYGRSLPGTAALVWRDGELIGVAPHRGAFRLWQVHPEPVVALPSADRHVTDFAVAADGSMALVESWPDMLPRLAVHDRAGRAIGVHDPNARLSQQIVLPTISRIEVAGPEPRAEAFVLRPSEDRRRASVIVDLHGGPHGSHPNPTLAAWKLWARLTGEGHTVVLPNPHGSTGYGLDFQKAVVGRWGGPDAADVLAMLNHVVRGTPEPVTAGITGWSYGGYLAAWLLTTTDRFAAGVLGGVISDLDRLAASTDIPDYARHEFGTAGAAQRSPLHRVRPGIAPVLLLHALHDQRCPADQATAFHRALRTAGTSTELVTYASSEHVFSSPALVAERIRRTSDWFRPLLGAPALRSRTDRRDGQGLS